MTELIAYLDPARPDDPRPALGVIYGRRSIVLFVDEEGVSGSREMKDVRGWAGHAHIRANPSQRDALLPRLGSDGFGLLPISAMEEVRVRTLIGRHRKENPPPPQPAEIDQAPEFAVPDPVETAGSPRFEGGVEKLKGAASELSDALSDQVRRVAWRCSDHKPVALDAHDPDDLDALLDQAFWGEPPMKRDENDAKAVPGPDSPPHVDPETDDLLSWDDLIHPDLAKSEKQFPSAGPETDTALPSGEVPDNPEPSVPDLEAGIVYTSGTRGALNLLLTVFSNRTFASLTASRIETELKAALKDDMGFPTLDSRLFGVWRKGGISTDREYLCVALVETVEYRSRIRAFVMSKTPTVRPEEIFARIVGLISDRCIGPIELMLPPPLLPAPSLLLSSGFRHIADLPRWSWTDDVSLWIRETSRPV